MPLIEISGRNAFDLDRILEFEPAFLEGKDHSDGMVTTMATT